MKYTKTELKNMIDSTYKKDGKAKAAAGVHDNPEEFRITNLTANIRVLAGMLCRMQDTLERCQDFHDTFNNDINVYEQAWRDVVDMMEWEIEYWDQRVDEVIEGGK